MNRLTRSAAVVAGLGTVPPCIPLLTDGRDPGLSPRV